MSTESKLSPMMEQWHRCKEQSGEALLLFRLGDFYEAFYDDAQILADALSLTLTQRQSIPMSGIPWHNLESYLDRLMQQGHLVAIAEQTEKPTAGKGIVHREIARIVSPATHTTTLTSIEKKNLFFASLSHVNAIYGLALVDLHTGEMWVMECHSFEHLTDELHKHLPPEILLSEKLYAKHQTHLEDLRQRNPFRLNIKKQWKFDHQTTYNTLIRHFAIHSLEAFGIETMTSAINAAGALISHLTDDLHHDLSHVKKIRPNDSSTHMAIDQTTARHLEIFDALLPFIDQTSTPMGGRLLRRWLSYPLLAVEKIAQRAESVAYFMHQQEHLSHLRAVKDLERLLMRLKTGHAGPRDFMALSQSLRVIPSIIELFQHSTLPPLVETLCSQLQDCTLITEKIDRALVADPPLRVTEGGVFRKGFHEELDALLDFKANHRNWLTHYQADLRQQLDIKTLKVSYTRAFGYYIEVSRTQTHKMPAQFVRRQTLVNQERYVSEDLREYEKKVYHTEELISQLEYSLFATLREEILSYSDAIQATAEAVAAIDTLSALALVAEKYGWVRPSMHPDKVIDVVEGWHPIVAHRQCHEQFIPNDVFLNDTDRQMILLTGPNMAGKSTYIRQVVLIVILAQIGSFVPARQANLGIVDKVFSRIGASDDLSRGQSTFMLEMIETANILNNATSRSLVILDEIGRGTSTYDGIAIAWSVAEYLLRPGHAPKTLFATHYWELTRMANTLRGIKNFRVAVQESPDGICFLHKIIPGEADKSYGIHVAKLAGLPVEVVTRAKQLLASLEKKQQNPSAKKRSPTLPQPSLFDYDNRSNHTR